MYTAKPLNRNHLESAKRRARIPDPDSDGKGNSGFEDMRVHITRHAFHSHGSNQKSEPQETKKGKASKRKSNHTPPKAKEVNPENLLTPEEKEEFAENNQALVYHIAKKYYNTGIEKEEIEGWAWVGFVKGLNTYDKSRADFTKLSTYIYKCMYIEITLNLRRCRAIMRTATEVSYDAEIAQKDGASSVAAADGISYRSLTNNGDDLSYVETHILEVETTESLKRYIFRLPKREQVILIASFGLFNQPVMTQEELGHLLNMSQANVSKVKNDAIKRMRFSLELEAKRNERLYKTQRQTQS